jgi:hypothetical protein
VVSALPAAAAADQQLNRRAGAEQYRHRLQPSRSGSLGESVGRRGGLRVVHVMPMAPWCDHDGLGGGGTGSAITAVRVSVRQSPPCGYRLGNHRRAGTVRRSPLRNVGHSSPASGGVSGGGLPSHPFRRTSWLTTNPKPTRSAIAMTMTAVNSHLLQRVWYHAKRRGARAAFATRVNCRA